MISRTASIAIVVPAMVLMFCVCGCAVGPNYKRPDLNVPGQYRGLPQGTSTQAASETFAEMKLAAVFPDEVLQGLLKEALVTIMTCASPPRGWCRPARILGLPAPISFRR